MWHALRFLAKFIRNICYTTYCFFPHRFHVPDPSRFPPPCSPATLSQPPAMARKRSLRMDAVAWQRPVPAAKARLCQACHLPNVIGDDTPI
jgi:hypothetical protein